MPLPLILIGISLVAGATGAASGVSGVGKIKDAKRIMQEAEINFNNEKLRLANKQKDINFILTELGKLKLDIWRDFKLFSNLFEKIKNKPQFTKNKEEEFAFTKHELNDIEEISVKALDILGSSLLSAGAGALAGFAVYGGTMTLGAASTGTLISTLSGAAATKATLAALGGGAISVGGGGIALGTTVLTGAVAGPVIAVSGLLLNAKGNDSVRKAIEVREEADKAIENIGKAINHIDRLSNLSKKLKKELKLVFDVYMQQVTLFKYLVDKETDYNKYTDKEKKILDNNIMLVKLLKHITQIDLIRKKKNEEVLQTSLIKKEIKKAQFLREKIAA